MTLTIFFGCSGLNSVTIHGKNTSIDPSAFDGIIKDENEKPTNTKRILGQVYVWYNPKTKTVCMDNIEVPNAIIKELTSSNTTRNGVSLSELLDIIEASAISLQNTMNRNNIMINQVTIGYGFNDLSKYWKNRYKLTTQDLEKSKLRCLF